jgi:tetratricopeptide (TPR) repeat protein
MYIALLKKIYDLSLTGTTITVESLLNINITSEQIKELIDNGLIYENRNGSFNITSVNNLFSYGKEQFLLGNKRTAQECFELCYRIKPKHRDTCLQLFYNAVLTRNYEEAYNFLYALENVSTNEYLRKDYKVYLYLLSQVSQVPEIYKTKIEDINSDPLFMLHRKPNNLQKQDNVIMRLILKGKYKFAIEKLNDFLSEDHNYAVHRIILKKLISQIIFVNDKYKSDILEKVKQKRYREIIYMLEEISSTRQLRNDEIALMNMIKIIISIYETGETPTPIENETTQVTEAILFLDYEKALSLESEFLVSKGIPLDKSPMYILLVEVNQLIKNINRLKENDIPIKPPSPIVQG